MSTVWKRDEGRATGSRRYLELLDTVAEMDRSLFEDESAMLAWTELQRLWSWIEGRVSVESIRYDIFKPAAVTNQQLRGLRLALMQVEQQAWLDSNPWDAEADVAVLREKDEQYGGSWKQRGGIGAFMMLARKWDRIEAYMAKRADGSDPDLLALIRADKRSEGIADDIRDLRRYLLLVECERRALAGE